MKRSNQILGALAIAAAVVSQSVPSLAGPLTGVKDVKVNVSGLNHYSESCGLTRDSFERAFFGAFKDGELNPAQSSGYWVSLQVTTVVFDETNCISNVAATLYLNTRYFNPSTLNEMGGRVEIWRSGGLYSSAADSHQVQVNNALRRFGRDLREKWKKDQWCATCGTQE